VPWKMCDCPAPGRPRTGPRLCTGWSIAELIRGGASRSGTCPAARAAAERSRGWFQSVNPRDNVTAGLRNGSSEPAPAVRLRVGLGEARPARH
jgi:hypothetical protein